MRLFIKPLTAFANTLYQGVDDTGRVTRQDSGYDLFVCVAEPIAVPARATVKLPLGVACALQTKYMSDGYTYCHGYWLMPRSSLYKKGGLIMSNSMGLIDWGYRGEICAMVTNVSDYTIFVDPGERLFQLCAPDLTCFEVTVLKEEESLDPTVRGAGGFGSTGGV